MTDLEQLLEPIAGASPSGVDPTEDSRFESVRNAIESGSEAAPVDWKKVRPQILDLLTDGRSLELLVYLSVALAATDGWQGVRDGLALLERSVKDYWDSIHPLLDESESEDERFIIRLNTLAQIGEAPRKMGDPFGYLEKVLRAPLSTTNRSAPGFWSAWEVEQGSGEAGEASAVRDYLLRAPAEDRETLKVLVDASVASLENLNSFLIEKTGLAFNGPFDEYLLPTLKEIGKSIASASSSLPHVSDAATSESDSEITKSASASQPPQAIGTIQSSDDVRKALNKVVEYYRKAEPSSPVPYILQRALKLVDADLMAIVSNLNKDTESQFRTTLDIPENED
jgi:type VI secretion system protein ImpA